MEKETMHAGAGMLADPFPLPHDLSGLAVFLDIDGTLLDIAATPDSIVVPDALPAAISGLARQLDGALALVTGRPVDLVDALFPSNGAAIAGLHGAEWRMPGQSTERIATSAVYERSKERLRDAVDQWSGAVFEDKGAAFAAHFRQAPKWEMEIRALMTGLQGEIGDRWTLQYGKCVIELRPSGRDKGQALKQFMTMYPFAGRRPFAIGDDLTDEAMFEAANGLGGTSVRVARDRRWTAARHLVDTPAVVRAWIGQVGA